MEVNRARATNEKKIINFSPEIWPELDILGLAALLGNNHKYPDFQS